MYEFVYVLTTGEMAFSMPTAAFLCMYIGFSWFLVLLPDVHHYTCLQLSVLSP